MNRILKRPMFRMGGSSGTGITSGLDRPRLSMVQDANGKTKDTGPDIPNRLPN